MSGLPPGDPQLVSMIVSHLKTQGLFDQFRRECLADVDTKPAYLNLKQRVDNFVSNHLSNHTWSPHLNKNQLRNNIRQLVLQSGMLEQGVDRIVAQVVDPKINHIFRPQVERVVREFLSPGSCSDEPMTPLPPAELKADAGILEQALSSTPATSTTSDAMSILDTISSLNQEASVRSSSATEKGRKILASDDTGLLVEENGQDISVEDGDENQDRKLLEETQEMMEVSTSDVKVEETGEFMEPGREGLTEEVKVEEEGSGGLEQTEDEKDKLPSKSSGKPSEEKPDDEVLRSKNQAKQKAKERIKEEYSLEDSDLEGLSDITVSSVHTSDLSSFEEESDEEEQLSDSSEEGELSDDDGKKAEKRHASEEQGEEDKERKPCRKAYVHKPFLYSRYYSDSDDEVTVEERRRSAAKDKEERLLKRQQNRERMEEKLKQKAAQAEQQDLKKQKSADSAGLEGPKAKEARKERKVLEKKMALNRKRKLDSRKEGDVSSKKKGDPGDTSKRAELKPSTSKTPQPKFVRNLSESGACDERHKRMSATISEESSDTKKLMEKAVTHAFILELEQGSQEALKQRSFGKFDRPSRKELHLKERKDKERSLSDDRIKPKQKQEKKSEQQVDESQHKEGAAAKGSSEEKAEKKLKTKSEKKLVSNTKDGKVAEGVVEDGNSKDAKKPKGSVECLKVEKDKEKREKEKIKEKEKAKGEKSLVKSEFKQLLCPDSAGSSEDRSDLETGPDGKKKDKHSKEVLKKSKSHTEPGDRPRLKTESEKEKTKPDQDSPKAYKPSSETDKDPKKVKSTEKGKILEKSKTKSKEESKAQVGPKTDKKTQSPDVKNAGTPPVSKLEAKKDKKKDGNVKDQLKVSEEAPSDKSGLKVGKKKVLKKDNVTEKKDEDKVQPPEGKSEKSDKSSKVSVSTLTSAAEDPPKNQLLHQDTSAESVPSAGNTLFSEPPEDNTELRLQMPQLPAEADALLTLMDVCASAEARLPSHSLKEEEAPEAELQDADMKMKEAALTLLSMDPDSTLSSSLICQDAKKEEEEPASPTVQQLLEASANEQERLPASQEQATPESDLTIPETSTAALQSENGVEESTNTAEEGENADRQTDAARPERSDVEAAQENAAILTSSKEKQAEDADIPAESHLEEKESDDEEMADVASEETEEITASTGHEMVDVVPKATENVCETCSESEQKEADPAVTEPNLWRIEAEADQNHTEKDAGYVESQREEEKDELLAEESDLLTVEADFSERMDVVAGPELEFPQDKKIRQNLNSSPIPTPSPVPYKALHSPPNGELWKHIVSEFERHFHSMTSQIVAGEVSVTDIQEENSSSDQEAEEKPSEVKLSVQEDTLNEESGDRRDEKETKELQPAEESEEGKEMEVQTHPSEGKSKTVQEEERDQSEELEKPKDSQSSSDVSVTSPTVDSLTDGSRTEHSLEETSSLHAAEEEKAEDQKEPERSGAEVSPPFSGSEEHKRPEKEESTKTTEICQSARKRKISEETEEPAEESQAEKEVKELSTQGGEDNSDHPTSVSLSDDVKHESGAGKKPDEGQEKHQGDQETPPKRRRGRPPKSALVEDSDQKEKKAPEKESEHADEEEEEDSEKEDEEKGSATRATTRLASRLEAERNKLIKPSTRASRQGGKEEAAAGARGTRGPAAVRGGRKREASPPAVRTRGGQKSEEPASKRAKR